MPPKTPKRWPPIAKLALLSQDGTSITVSTVGTVPGATGQGRTRVTSTLAGWTMYWGDGQQQSGSGAPPLQMSHVYAVGATTVFLELVVVDMNTLSAQATLTVNLQTSTIPAAPTNVTASALSASSIRVDWSAVPLATLYSVERSIDGVNFLPVGSVSVTTFTDTGLSAATVYLYRVQAFNQTIGGPYSAIASATTFSAPLAPSALTATTISTTRIDLAWTDNSSNEDGFKIERSLDGVTFAQIATVASGVVVYADTGLTPNTFYVYRVRAYNAFGDSAYSNTDDATTDQTTPTAPTNLTATAISPTRIDLVWINTSTIATSIRIERKIGAGAFATLDTVAPTTTSYSNTGLSAATTYSYRLFAVNAAGDSPASNTSSATTTAGTAPTAPSALVATALSSTTIGLSWTDNSTDEDGFKIERDTVQIATVAAGVTSFTDAGLTPNTAYNYRVRAYNAAGNSAYSNTSPATTNDTVPSAPTNLTATAVSSSEIDLAWTNTATNATSIRIEVKVGAGSFTTLTTVSAVTTTFPHTGLLGSTTYTYRLFAVNAFGDSPASISASATTSPSLTPPAAPSGAVATTISASAITVTWTDNSTNESGFLIQRALGAGSFADLATVGQGVTSLADTGLAQSQLYRYQIRAFNAAGNSAFSNIAQATTSQAVPAAPTGLSATAVSPASVSLTWTAPVASPTNGAPSSIAVQRRIAPASFATIQALTGTANSYLDTTVAAGTMYDYRLIATNPAGSSSPSNTASVTTPANPTPPNAPSTLAATPVSASAINLTWTDNSTDESGFVIQRALGASGTFADIATVSQGVVAFSDTGLAQSQLYRYQVRAYNSAGSSAYSNIASATTNLAVPAAPTNLSAAATSQTSVSLTWTPPVAGTTNGTPTNILVQRRISPAAFATIQTLSGTASSATDATAVASTTYDYRLIATNAAGSSAASNTASVTTPAPPPAPPNAPSSLIATAPQFNQVNLSWTDNSSDESGFRIERSTTGAAGPFTEIGTVAANIVNFADSSVSASTAYSYRVRAYNQNGNSTYSNVASITTPAIPLPAAPTGLTVGTITQTSIALSWTDNATNETGYSLERSISGGAFAVLTSLPAGTTTYTDQSLSAATQYSYRVRAFNGTGNSAYSNTVTATTQAIPPQPPLAPTSLAASLTGTQQVTLTWVDNATNETGYTVERRVSATPTFATIATLGSNIATYVDSTVALATSYDYRVRAFNAAGNSAYSNIVTIAVPGAPPPPGPTVLGPSDLVYDGCFGVPPAGTPDPFGSWGSMTGRVVNGQPRIFMLGNHNSGSQLYEFAPPATLASSPAQLTTGSTFRGTLVRNWGNIYGEDPNVGNVKRENGPGNITDVDGGILFLNGKLYWEFWASYNVAGVNNRVIGLSTLNDSTGVGTRSGPWRLGGVAPHVGAKFCNNGIAEIPSGFATLYLGGKRIHLAGAVGASGAASSPTGIGFLAINEIAASLPESSISNASDIAITPQELIAYDTTHRQPLALENFLRRLCGWNDPGIHAVTTAPVAAGATSIPINDTSLFAKDPGSGTGGYLTTWYGYVGPESGGLPFGYNAKSTQSGPGNLTGIPASGDRSITAPITTGTIISLGKYDVGRGGFTVDPVQVLGPDNAAGDFLGNFWDSTGAPCWITAPNGKQGVLYCGSAADSVPGANYGTDNRTHVRYAGVPICPHGQDASAYFQGTGPVSTTTTQVAWIYDQNDFAKIAQGTLLPANLTPAYYFRWNPIAPGISLQPAMAGGIRAAWYDAVNGKLYLCERNADASFGSSRTNIVHRFTVGGGVTPPIPNPPSNLVASNVTQSTAQLTWTDASSNETGFSLERAVGGGAFAVIQTFAPNVTSFLDTFLTASSTYTYRIRAFNQNGNSSYSNVATAVTPNYGPRSGVTQPAGSIVIPAGSTTASRQTLINANPGATFWIRAGLHSANGSNTPSTGQTFVGEFGAIIDGTGWVTTDGTQAVFRAHLQNIDNVTIRNLVIRNCPQRGIHTWHDFSDNWLVENCEITTCYCALSLPNSSTARGCYLHHNNGDSQGGFIPNGGYIVSLAHDVLFENNDISFNGDIQKVVDQCVNTTFRYNFIHDNLGAGIWHDGDNTGVLIESNLIQDNGQHGIIHEISGSATMRNNRILRNAITGIFLSTSKNVTVTGNYLEDNLQSLNLLANMAAVGGGVIGWDLANNTVSGNTVVVGSQSGVLVDVFQTLGVGADPTPYTNNSKQNNWSGNTYRVPSALLGASIWYWQTGKTFAQWQALPQDPSSTLTART